MSKRTLVIGASDKKDRYANRAMLMLKEAGHEVEAVGNRNSEAWGVPIYKFDEVNWSDYQGIDTVTLYVSERYQMVYEEIIKKLKPRRVLFNPGTENTRFFNELQELGVEVEEACTLVLISTGQY